MTWTVLLVGAVAGWAPLPNFHRVLAILDEDEDEVSEVVEVGHGAAIADAQEVKEVVEVGHGAAVADAHEVSEVIEVEGEKAIADELVEVQDDDDDVEVLELVDDDVAKMLSR